MHVQRDDKCCKGLCWEDTVWGNYHGKRYLEDDIVNVWGRVKGLRTYTAVLGQEITVPEIDVLHMELIGHD